MSKRSETSAPLGKFVVIEGTDGSGKTTQLNCLVDHYSRQLIPTHVLDFPQYDKFWGRIVGKFLNGDFGELDEISPYLIQPYYMLDQASQKDIIRQKLAEGSMVLSNRYLTSSMAHQTAKLPEKKRTEFLQWLMEAGYTQLEMPKPDLVIVLYLPPEISMQLSKQAHNNRKKYAQTREIAEDHVEHQQKSAQMYKNLCAQFPEWQLIECTTKAGELLSIEAIHAKVLKILGE